MAPMASSTEIPGLFEHKVWYRNPLFYLEKLIVCAKQPGVNIDLIAIRHFLLAQTPEQLDNGGYSSDNYADDESEGGGNIGLGYGQGSSGNGIAGRLVGAGSELDNGGYSSSDYYADVESEGGGNGGHGCNGNKTAGRLFGAGHLSPRHSDNTSRRISFQPMSFSTRRFRFVGIAGPHFYGAYALVCLLKLAQPIHTAPMASSTEVARLFEQKVWYSRIIIPSRKADCPRKAARHKHCCSAFSVGADA